MWEVMKMNKTKTTLEVADFVKCKPTNQQHRSKFQIPQSFFN
jgi:hypothetical protein